MRSRIHGSLDRRTASSSGTHFSAEFSSGFTFNGSSELAWAKYVTFRCKCEPTYAPRFSWPFTVSTSSEKNVATVRAEIDSWKRFKTLRETVFARRVLFERKVRTFQNAILSSKLAFDRNTAAIRKNATMHAGFFFEFAKRYRTQISHAVGMATNPRPRLVDVVPFEKRALKRGINRPYRCRHMRLRRTLETIGIAFEGTKNHLFIDRFLLIERLKSLNIGNQSGAVASHRFHMHSFPYVNARQR